MNNRGKYCCKPERKSNKLASDKVKNSTLEIGFSYSICSCFKTVFELQSTMEKRKNPFSHPAHVILLQ